MTATELAGAKHRRGPDEGYASSAAVCQPLQLQIAGCRAPESNPEQALSPDDTWTTCPTRPPRDRASPRGPPRCSGSATALGTSSDATLTSLSRRGFRGCLGRQEQPVVRARSGRIFARSWPPTTRSTFRGGLPTAGRPPALGVRGATASEILRPLADRLDDSRTLRTGCGRVHASQRRARHIRGRGQGAAHSTARPGVHETVVTVTLPAARGVAVRVAIESALGAPASKPLLRAGADIRTLLGLQAPKHAGVRGLARAGSGH